MSELFPSRRGRLRGPGCRRLLRRVRRPLRARDGHAGARRAHRGLRGRAATTPSSSRARRPAPDYVGRPTPLYRAKRLAEAVGLGTVLPQARGPLPHRRAQDQQHARPVPARQAHGQEARHRRDGRRPARRGDRDGRRADGPRVRGLHGRRGHPPTVAQRLQDAAARRRGRPGRRGHRHARRRRHRRAAPLGRARRGHVLRARLGGRTAPVPDDGARLPERHRARDDRPAPGARRAGTSMPSWRAWAVAATRSAPSTRSCSPATVSAHRCSWAPRPRARASTPTRPAPR